MSEPCREAESLLTDAPADARVAARVAAHCSRCAACRARAAEHDRLVGALRGADAGVDEVTRARWLARMAPAIDAIATRHATAAPPRRAARWLVPLIAAAAGAVLTWSIVRERSTPRVPLAPQLAAAIPAPIAPPPPMSLAIVRPYVVSGAASEDAATALLAGRFAALDVAPGVVVRAGLDGAPGAHLTAQGPARVEVAAVTADRIELTVDGVVLIEVSGGPGVQVRGGGLDVWAQDARFAAATGGAPVVFVDRGALTVGGAALAAGQWSGPDDRRTSKLVAALREHGVALRPPVGGGGVIAVPGPPAPVATEAGAVLGAAPLWARVDAGALVVVIAGARDERLPIAIRDGAIERVERATVAIAPAPAPRDPTPAPLAPAPREPTAAQLYADAEAALRAGDPVLADQRWTELVARYPASHQARSAMYDLATLARTRGDLPGARAWIDRLLAASPPAALVEPAAYLGCRLAVDAGGDAATCFRDFRARFADSPHDAEVLAWLIGRADAAGDCPAALAREYLQRYPRGAFATRARGVLACEAAP